MAEIPAPVPGEDGPEWEWISTWAEDADFILESDRNAGQIALVCRQCDPPSPLFTVGVMELWEFVIDGARHFLEKHDPEAGNG